jgi:hypothetical protein
MAIQCFTFVRSLGASAHHHIRHAAHHLVGRHLPRVHHAVLHGVVSPHTAGLRATVCVVTGVAAVGAGGLVVAGKIFLPSPVAGPTKSQILPGGSVPSEPDDLGEPLSSFIPVEIGSLPDPQTSFVWSETGSPPEASRWADPSESSSATVAIREPATGLVFSVGLLGLAVLRRRTPFSGSTTRKSG